MVNRPDLRVLHNLKSFLTANRIAECFAVNIRTVFRWLALPLDFVSPPRTGRPKRIDQSNLPMVFEILKEKPWTTMEELRGKLEVDASSRTVHRFVRKNKITKKRGHTIFRERNEADVERFKGEMREQREFHMALDEASFCINDAPRYGWAPKGKRAYIRKPGGKGKRLSLVLCVSDSPDRPIVGFRFEEETFDSGKFHDFLESSVSERGRLIMDNASIHKAIRSCEKVGKKSIRDLCASKGIDPVYLPAYSPTLNPVELCFNFIRTVVRREFPTTKRALRATVERAISQLGSRVQKMFVHCFGC
jgi:transposase